MVVVRPQVQDRATEQAEVHADLHQHREVAERHRLEAGHGGTDVAAAAVLRREPHPERAGRGHLLDHCQHPVPERVGVEVDLVVQDLRVLDEVLAGELPHPGVRAVQDSQQGRYVDGGLHVVGHEANSASRNREGQTRPKKFGGIQ